MSENFKQLKPDRHSDDKESSFQKPRSKMTTRYQLNKKKHFDKKLSTEIKLQD